ncbi:MAG: hypothetical protein JSV44_04575, partial [Candidatus Zixiibacteriota bacterium]
MRYFPQKNVMVILGLLAGLIIYGCSQDSPTTAEISGSTGALAAVAQYFPVQEGLSADFTITDNRNQTLGHQRLSIGRSVRVNGRQAYCWIFEDLDNPGLADTGYLFGQDGALFYFEQGDIEPERILEAPFILGREWERFPATTSQSYDQDDYDNLLDSNLTGYNGKDFIENGEDDPQEGYGTSEDDDLENNEVAPLPSTPAPGSNTLKIRALNETIELEGGGILSNCLRVENKNGGIINRYWYSGGIGLVRYALSIS